MIKEGVFTFVDGCGWVEPFKGKYAVKNPRVFDLIRAGWEQTRVSIIVGAYPYQRS